MGQYQFHTTRLLPNLRSKVKAYYDHNFNTIRHSNCDWIINNSSDSTRCDSCKHFRNNYLTGKLQTLQNRSETQDVSSYEASSHVNYRYLDTPGKLQRMKNLHSKVRKQAAEIRSVRKSYNTICKAKEFLLMIRHMKD